ncbi:class I SAM-dependent methyltransferase [Patescibacteria group bacterium]|nr:class I SAM-dependent methyltransferase [Patescibacteria group bacterium]
MAQNFFIEELGGERILIIGDKKYSTFYSKTIIEMIIGRKGIKRTPEYLQHKKDRSRYLEPLFEHFKQANVQNVRILEVGCASGAVTEYLQEQKCISEIYTYDVDREMVEITKLKREELHLNKVVEINHFTNEETLCLPYENDFFDLIIVNAIVEHLPFENRYLYIDQYYKKLKQNGLIGFFDTPNRRFPFEKHSIGLPFIHRMVPENAFIYAKLFGKIKNADFTDFVRLGTGWRNSSYYELLPKTIFVDVKDVSKDVGYYGKTACAPGRTIRKLSLKSIFISVTMFVSKLLNIPASFWFPSLNVVFRKEKNYE